MNALAIRDTDDTKLYESLALRGDLSALTPQDKARYYASLCERLEIDPTTQPFMPLKMNGKEILYASRGCTDQLARKHHVDRQIIKEEEIRGAYVVTVEATLPNGRREQSKGAVPVEGLKGDAFCNAIMKAETKAKRRATLSILGLGMLDETELETIPAYRREAAEAVEPVIEPGPVISEESIHYPRPTTVEAEPAEENSMALADEPPDDPRAELRWLAWKLGYTDEQLLKWLRKRYPIDKNLNVTQAILSLDDGELEQAILSLDDGELEQAITVFWEHFKAASKEAA